MAKRGAKSIFEAEKRGKLIAALKGIKGVEGYDMPSRYIQQLLAEQELVAFEVVKTGGRGRPAHVAKLTSKGHARVNFAK